QLPIGTQRRRASSQRASAESGSLRSAVAPTTIDGDETVLATVESDAAAPGDSPIAGKRVRRGSTSEAQLPAPPVAARATHRPHDAPSSLQALEAQEADLGGGSVPAAAALLTDQGLLPTDQSTRPEKPRSRRQPNQAITASPSTTVDASTSIQKGQQPTMEAYPTSQPVVPPAVELAEILSPSATAKAVTEERVGTRRPKRSTKPHVATDAAPQQTPASTEAQTAAQGRPLEEVAAED